MGKKKPARIAKEPLDHPLNEAFHNDRVKRPNRVSYKMMVLNRGMLLRRLPQEGR